MNHAYPVSPQETANRIRANDLPQRTQRTRRFNTQNSAVVVPICLSLSFVSFVVKNCFCVSGVLTGDKHGMNNRNDRQLKLWLLGCFAVCACSCAIAAPPAANESDEVQHSASLQGVKRWEDATPADLNAESTYLLPGFFHAKVTLENVRRRFGASNVRVGKVAGAEGEEFNGIVLFGSDPQRRVEIFFADDANQRGIGTIRVTGAKSRWHFDNGLRLGTTLAELVAKNGAPISYSGLDWDYGGAINDWHGGRLDALSRGVPPMSIGLTHGENASGYPLGEDTYRSDDKKYPRALSVLYVGMLSVDFEDRD
jgi:hypothetical protein